MRAEVATAKAEAKAALDNADATWESYLAAQQSQIAEAKASAGDGGELPKSFHARLSAMAPRHAAPFWAALLLACALLATPAVAAASGRKALSVETPDAAPADAAAAATPEAPTPATPTTSLDAPSITPEAAAAAPDTASAASAAPPPDSTAPAVPQIPSPPPAESSYLEAPIPRAASSTTRRRQRKSDGPMPTTVSVAPTARIRRVDVGAPTTVTEEGNTQHESAASVVHADATGAIAISWGGERDGYKSVYLDRHLVGDKCDQGLNGWKLNMRYRSWPNTAQMRFEYSCAYAPARSFSTFRTGANDWGNGNTVFLDRHNVNCGPNRVLSDWKLVRPSTNQIAIQFVCANVPSTVGCLMQFTDWTSNGRGQVNFLDRHRVQCPGSKKLNHWQLRTNNAAGQYRVQYICCDT
ncbi:hypothetical protein Rsub_13259 [Raphidocelis subcapitata]|uniref:Uncharacterized protein n=1 Tax=Raphidocelis subcapitata TaxID=307507 RepID=A0A2V0PKQ4_9CHLO|nr:hypothetical protein Rsub_13259 [Raphidocelis subcapitata]|eukprot:GBG00369.1 hypothetical protein Rsub_13259 [Raphidocelis subcapitata]